jgi:hypothetical protein
MVVAPEEEWMRKARWMWLSTVWVFLACETNDAASVTDVGSSTTGDDAMASDAASPPEDVAPSPLDVAVGVDLGQSDDTGPAVDDVGDMPGDVEALDVGEPDVGDPDVSTAPDVEEADTTPDPVDGGGCVPACDGLVCGPDGCGGDCGVCTGGEVCTLGLCSAPGACTNDADGSVLGSVDVAGTVEGCAKGCVLATDKAVCGGDCLAKETGLSASCAACFGGNVACAFTKCTFECGFGSAEKCLECQTTAGCFVEFEACAGLLPP